MKNVSQPGWRSLAVALVLICSSSLILHVLVFSKKQRLHYQRYANGQATPSTEMFVPAGPPIEGEVLAIGLDRIHVREGVTGRATFRCPEPGRYRVGQKVRVFYSAGAPPSVVKIELLQK